MSHLQHLEAEENLRRGLLGHFNLNAISNQRGNDLI